MNGVLSLRVFWPTRSLSFTNKRVLVSSSPPLLYCFGFFFFCKFFVCFILRSDVAA